MDIIARGAQHAARTAVTSGGRRYTYANVLDSSERLSSAVSRLVQGSTSPPRVGLYAAPGAEYLAATLAIWRAGGVVVPLATSHPQRELEYVMQDAGISMVLTPEAHAGKLEEVAAGAKAALHIIDPVEGVEDNGSGGAAAAAAERGGSPSSSSSSRLSSTDADRGALIIYTSGTTGKPKGVLHRHRSIDAQVRGLAFAWQWRADDTILHPLPLHHIHGIVNALYCPAYVGATVAFVPSFAAGAVWREIVAGRLSVFMGVPTMYSHLLTHYDTKMTAGEQADARHAAAALRLAVSGSAACPVPVQERWRALTGGLLLERYGMTEVGMALSNPYAGAPRVPGAVGQPLPGVDVRISGDGELQVRGDTVFSEYWGNAAATAEAFTPDGWFRTGDSADTVAATTTAGTGTEAAAPSAQLLPEYHRILGRTSVDIIKSAGYKLSALQIESVVLEHPGVAEVAVIGVPDEVYGEVVTALVARKPSAPELSQHELTGFVRERLAGYQCPKRWRFVDALPRNAMGKLNKKELLKDYLAGEAAAAAAAATA
ncbi:hypothetical protein FOA52_000121 [Chlamydomonas sp. UWO 241]|nr:hypothetical protein FOA52_000121 [Chlamydomonas sp. UWO 241]